jgi:hypothetical protein
MQNEERDFVDEIVRQLPREWRLRDAPYEWVGDTFPRFAIEQLLDGRKAELWQLIDLEGAKWLLVVIDENAHVVRFGGTDQQPEAEFKFLGSLAGGRYAETLRLDENEVLVLNMKFEHPELPGGEFTLEAKDERGMLEAKRVRRRCRRWAGSGIRVWGARTF